MKMISLRILASIAIFSLALAHLAPEALAYGKQAEQDLEMEGKLPEPEQAADSEKKAGSKESKDSSAPAEKTKGKNKKDKDKNEKEDDKQKEKDKKDKGKDKEAEAEAAAVPVLSQAALDRAKALKAAVTPFNTAVDESSLNSNNGNTLSIRNGGSLRSSLSSRLVTNRVYLPGKLVIGKPADFVVKARPGSHVAIAMADKDSGAKSIFGHNLRLGADRKLVAAGTIPESGVLTLTMDMPIQGDLIGVPVFFETAIWQKPDFSDIELAAPVKSESVDEIADKVNAVIVSGEKEQKRGLRIVPESGVPLHQRGNTSLESGRP